MIEQFARLIVRWRWLVIIAGFLAVGFTASGVQNLGFTTSYRAFFAEDNLQLQAFDNIQETYSKSDNIMYMVVPESGDVYNTRTLQLVKDLTEASWQLPYSTRVDSLSNYQNTVAEEDDLIIGDLIEDTADLSAERLDYIRQLASTEPLLVHRLVSAKGHVTGVNVTFQLPELSENETPEAVAAARIIADKFSEAYPDHKIMLTGMVMMNNAFGEAAQADMQSLIPMMFLVVILTLAVLLRSVFGTISTVIVIMMSIATAMGLTGWLGWQITPPSASAPTIILTMAVADCVHILVSYFHSMRSGMKKHDAMVESIRINFMPIFITSLTTSIGFLTMNFSEVPPFHDLGNIVAMGVFAAFILSVTFLPALTVIFPTQAKQREERKGNIDKVADFVINNRRKLLWSISGLTIVLVAMVPRNELNDEFVKYFDESVAFRQASDYANENLTSVYTIEYSLSAGEDNGIANPTFIKNIDNFAQWLRKQPETQHVNSISDTYKRLNKSMHGDDQAWYKLPEQQDLAAQYLLMYEFSLPYGLDLNNQIDVAKSSTRVIATFESQSTSSMLTLEKKVNAWLAKELPQTKVLVGSPNLMFAHIGYNNVKSMLGGTLIALILISIILILALRSLRIGLMSLAPNLVPAAMAFGLWGLFVGEIGMSLATAVGMTLGIVVDDTVHFLSKYLRARREKGLSSEEAVRYAFSTVGVALWVTTFVLVSGFIILSLSSFKMNADMGLMTAMTIALALVVDFLFLPALLMKVEEKN
jgi:predicted RND superfamily exporter protein